MTLTPEEIDRGLNFLARDQKSDVTELTMRIADYGHDFIFGILDRDHRMLTCNISREQASRLADELIRQTSEPQPHQPSGATSFPLSRRA